MKLITAFTQAFTTHADINRAASMSQYMKCHFTYFGIAQPLRKELQKKIFSTHLITSQDELIACITELWNMDEREYQYVACDLALHYKKLWDKNIVHLFESMLLQKQWWDSIDTIAPKLMGTLIMKHPEIILTIDEYIVDKNFWIRRSALIFQLNYKNTTDHERLFRYCQLTTHEKEFFIRKAIGWALRQYSKTNPDAVRNFIAQHKHALSPLSIREGSKYLK